MTFPTLPPEINSLRMFLGAGSGPMLQAAAAWDGLAAELGSAADSFGSVISNLAGQAWQGAASAAMAAAAAPYAGWLAAAASQSLGAASQARSVVSAFEAARAATVHPSAVEQNRNAFVNLVMSNLFGQNAPLIMMAESIYEEMWAADVTAMTGYYAGAAAAAAEVVPWQTVLQSFPALTAGLAGGLSAAAQAGSGSGAASGAAGSAPAAAGPVGGGAAGAAAGGGGGSAAGAMGSADQGLAPASYAASDPSAYTAGGPAAPADASGLGSTPAYTAANTGAVGSGVGAMGMMPMVMAGLARAGLLGDSPSMPVPVKSEKSEETVEAAPQEEVVAETPETPEVEVPAMSVLPTVVPDAAAKAAPGEAPQVARTSASGIPQSGLRAVAKPEESAEGEETSENVATLRPEITPGEFRPREEEAPKIRLRG